VAYAFDVLTFPHMLAVGFVMGLLGVLFNVSYSSLFVALVPRDRFVEGSSILNGSRALSYVGGPSVGGVLVQVLSAPVTLVVDACSYLLSAFCLYGVEVEEPPAEAPGKGTSTSAMVTLICGSSSRGVTSTANRPCRNATSASSGVS
jgi:hypothetical protein